MDSFLTIGTIFAVAISYSHNQSFGWGVVHGLLHWFYVAWIMYADGENMWKKKH